MPAVLVGTSWFSDVELVSALVGSATCSGCLGWDDRRLPSGCLGQPGCVGAAFLVVRSSAGLLEPHSCAWY